MPETNENTTSMSDNLQPIADKQDDILERANSNKLNKKDWKGYIISAVGVGIRQIYRVITQCNNLAIHSNISPLKCPKSPPIVPDIIYIFHFCTITLLFNFYFYLYIP